MFTDGKMWCQTINYSLLACYSWKRNWKITSGTEFMSFLVKALFRWNESSKNADISVLSSFLAIFSNFSLDIEKFYQVLSTRQISDQFVHSNRNYGGGIISPPPAIKICKSPACLGLKFKWHENFYCPVWKSFKCQEGCPLPFLNIVSGSRVIKV